MKMLPCCVTLVLVFYKSIQADVDFSINPFLEDSKFIITNKEYWAMQEYMNSLLKLTAPAGNDAISNNMRPKLDKWKTQATTWKSSLRSQTQQYSLEIATFASIAVETFESVRTSVADGKKEEVQPRLTLLKNSVADYRNKAHTISNLLATYKEQVDEDAAEAKGFYDQFTNIVQASGVLITSLTNNLKSSEENIQTLNRNYDDVCFSKGYTPVYTVTEPFGTIISPPTMQVADFAISALVISARVIKAIMHLLSGQLNVETRKIVYANTWNTSLKKLHGLYQSVQVSFGKILGIWTTQSNTIDVALDKFDKYGPDTIRTWRLSSAISTWTTVANLANAYSSTVNIQVQ